MSTQIIGDNLVVPGTATIGTATISSLALPLTSTAVDYIADVHDEFIEVTATGKTVTLPAVANVPIGKRYLIKLTAVGTSTVAANGAETIDGAGTFSITARYKFVEVESNGTQWLIRGQN